jgi:anaerobic ribonucleoside-triphosphate reductase activating protein
MKIRLSSPLTVDSIVDGPGLRAVVWTQGCMHKCPGCHNEQTHDLEGGFETSLEDIKLQIEDLKLHKGITISGGEPFLQPEQCAEIAEFARSKGLDVWCYTGFTYEQLSKSEKHKRLLKNVDVLIDGPFMQEQRSLELKFKGSKNQRCLRLKDGEVIEIQ